MKLKRLENNLVAIPNDRSRSLKLGQADRLGGHLQVAIPNDRSRSLKLGQADRLGGHLQVAIPNDRSRSLKQLTLPGRIGLNTLRYLTTVRGH